MASDGKRQHPDDTAAAAMQLVKRQKTDDSGGLIVGTVTKDVSE